MSSTTVASESPIPVIDFAGFEDNAPQEQRRATATEVFQALRDIGFVYLINHGLPQEKIDQMFHWSKQFFALPSDVKGLAPHPASAYHHRGYSPPGLEKVSQNVFDKDELSALRAVPDVKESFESGREDDPDMPNVWLPDDVLPGFKEACLDFYWTLYKIELLVLRALSLGLGLNEDYFASYHKDATCQLRLLHYPSVPVASLRKGEIERIGAHSDFGSITLLLQDDIGGLEIEDPTQKDVFRPAPPVKGSIIVNAGDFLMRWSNDTIKSTLHRVRAPPHLASDSDEAMTPERYSIPYFCAADRDTKVECLPGTFSEQKPKRYDPITAGEYVRMRLEAIY